MGRLRQQRNDDADDRRRAHCLVATLGVAQALRNADARGFVRDFAVQGRPGWIFRDRGRLAVLETAVGLAASAGILIAVGFFSGLPTFAIAALCLMAVVGIWRLFAGQWCRNKAGR